MFIADSPSNPSIKARGKPPYPCPWCRCLHPRKKTKCCNRKLPSFCATSPPKPLSGVLGVVQSVRLLSVEAGQYHQIGRRFECVVVDPSPAREALFSPGDHPKRAPPFAAVVGARHSKAALCRPPAPAGVRHDYWEQSKIGTFHNNETLTQTVHRIVSHCFMHESLQQFESSMNFLLFQFFIPLFGDENRPAGMVDNATKRAVAKKCCCSSLPRGSNATSLF